MTKIVDLDKLETEKSVTVQITGKDGVKQTHEMRTLTMKQYINNIKKARDLLKNNNDQEEQDEMSLIEKNINALNDQIMEAFPTMTPEIIDQLTPTMINKLSTLITEYYNGGSDEKN